MHIHPSAPLKPSAAPTNTCDNASVCIFICINIDACTNTLCMCAYI